MSTSTPGTPLATDPAASAACALPLEDTRVESFTRVVTPAQLHAEIAATAAARATVARSRAALRAILQGGDARRFLVVGPCSVHDADAALEYAARLGALAAEVDDVLVLVMRMYFEKPRTTVGWKGLINDPDLDGRFDIERGLRVARGLLAQIAALGVAAGTEALDPVIPQYFSDLVSWYAIGARTTESQTHREMASGLSAPVGFKNGTDGTLSVAVNAWLAALGPHAFLGIDAGGEVSVVRTRGDPDGHVILRGGRAPNFDGPSLAAASAALQAARLPVRLVVDCSHGNSGKDPARQLQVLDAIAPYMQAPGTGAIVLGAMLESNLQSGTQKLVPGVRPARGISVTDACIGWDETRSAILGLAEGLRRSASLG